MFYTPVPNQYAMFKPSKSVAVAQLQGLQWQYGPCGLPYVLLACGQCAACKTGNYGMCTGN